MLIILLLVLMFTGLGLLAMRHTRGELRAAGAYLDSVQAAALAEAAVIMAATDLRFYDEYACINDGAEVNYRTQYSSLSSGERMMTFSPAFQGGNPNMCAAAMGQLPDPQLSGMSPLADTAVLSVPRASVQVFHSPKIEAPWPPGFSPVEDYGFYWYTIRATATYGEQSTAGMVTTGQATARARVYMGPHRR